ncbi:dTDP-4-dehydrorhamnose reductase [uncultured Psychroserpens sp.]|uniref:dTDP-4-dehydrorhamnose reductase n=1 Tax=uncultured Psychroserpens sp. TaxID=255436 RepID=UPI00261A7644|nr:dTDP-4-dehydrorhamnose reductase [uncultured Psychroserpens sp.]
MNILVTGSKGQLATCIKDIETYSNDKNLHFIYKNSKELNILDANTIETFFNNNDIDYCINCAAYTAVDKAESNTESAININEIGVKNLAKACSEKQITLIHVSTDFVFDGSKSTPYTEEDKTNPIGVYGSSKLKGEQQVMKQLSNYFIIRTSWLYSEHGNNFLKSMIKLSKEKNELRVVVDQVGTPTYAKDLAKTIIKIIENNNQDYGIYNYSNQGVASWYDFAKAIFEENDTIIDLYPIKSEAYKTPARRPHYSVLDKTKIERVLNIKIPYWRDSLKKALINVNNKIN